MITVHDMHIRDERLLAWLQSKNKQKIPAHVIADEFGCHPHTARAMLKRLQQAGYIEITLGTRGGSRIKLTEKSCNLNSH